MYMVVQTPVYYVFVCHRSGEESSVSGWIRKDQEGSGRDLIIMVILPSSFLPRPVFQSSPQK
jgi:hypothetical protein